MHKIPEIIKELTKKKDIRFTRLLKICENYFGKPRIAGSHHIFKTPWPGDPRINLQSTKDNRAKPYQIQQVIQALQKLQETLKNDGR
jgi:hypothetical protein